MQPQTVLDSLKLLYQDRGEDLSQSLKLFENLHLRASRRWWYPMSWREEVKIAYDLISLRDLISGLRTPKSIRLTSQKLQGDAELLSILKDRHLTDRTREMLKQEYLEPLRHYIAAVILADLVGKDFRQDRLRYLMSTALLLFAALAALLKIMLDWAG
jgi:hypothetical protein